MTEAIDTPVCNQVTLLGRVSAPPEGRDLPSGDRLVTLRVIVDRPPPKRRSDDEATRRENTYLRKLIEKNSSGHGE